MSEHQWQIVTITSPTLKGELSKVVMACECGAVRQVTALPEDQDHTLAMQAQSQPTKQERVE